MDFTDGGHTLRGMSLIEVLMTLMIIATAVLALASSSISSTVSTRTSSEYSAAVRAAREKLEQIGGEVTLDTICTKYKPGGTVGNAFDVILEYAPSGNHRFLPGLNWATKGANNIPMAGEVVIISKENAQASDYGRDLSPHDGRPDGVNFKGLPMDLNVNGNTTDGERSGATTNKALRYPIGVVIRWAGAGGREERYEMWTIVSAF